jgi:hypothetical protein
MADDTRIRLPWYKWYPYDAARDDVWSRMTFSERGVYKTLLDHQWIYGDISLDPYRLSQEIHGKFETVRNWLNKYGYLFPCTTCGTSHFTPETESGWSQCGVRMESGRTQVGVRKESTRSRGGNLKLWNQQDTDAQKREEEKRGELEDTDTSGGFDDSQASLGSEQEETPEYELSIPPVQPETKVPPVSPTAKPESTPAREAAQHLFKLLGQPKVHIPKATAWTKLMQGMLDETGADLNDWKDFLTFTFTENFSEEDSPRYTSNWMPTVKDPCQTLKDKLHEWYLWPDWSNNKKRKKAIAKKKGQSAEPSKEIAGAMSMFAAAKAKHNTGENDGDE